MADYRIGQIVYAPIHDGLKSIDGKKSIKIRPVVIIDNEVDFDDEIMVIAISTKCQIPCPYYHIQVHHGTATNVYTGLSEASWAKCNFVRFPRVTRIRNHIGDMPDPLLEKILKAHDRIANMGDRFRDWQ
jgi:mRNA-degrading endonuclease toxin of MazEF toxin-antitoxin module